MSLRVCMVVLNNYYKDGRVRRYAESLADHGAVVDVLCSKTETPKNAYRSDIRVYAIPLRHSSNSLIGYLFEYSLALLLFSIWLVPLQVRRRYDVIHIHNMPDHLVFCGLFSRLLGARLLLDFHDPMPEFYQSKYDDSQGHILQKLLAVQERVSARLADAVIAANSNFKKNLIARGTPAEKITVIHNFADTQTFDRNRFPRAAGSEAHARFVLIYPGTIAARYGLDLPIRAASTLAKKIPGLLIRIVGPSNDYSQQLEALASELQIESHVEILPAVAAHEVPRLMAQADIGIYPALPGPHMSIATPTKVLEYAQMGLPIVASRLPALEQFFDEDSVRFFKAGDVNEFTAAIGELWSSPELRASLVKQADEKFVRQRTWQRECDTYFGLLDRLIAKGSHLETTPTSSDPECQ